jgi:chromosome segregation ATPase
MSLGSGIDRPKLSLTRLHPEIRDPGGVMQIARTAKQHIAALALTTLVAFFGVTATVGCSSTGTDRAAATQKGADALAADFDGLANQVETTVRALGGLEESQDGDLSKAFANYQKQVDALHTRAGRVRSNIESLRTQTKDHIAAWDAQTATIQDGDVRSATEARREKAEERFSEIRAELERASREYEEFDSKIVDIRTALDVDLNPAGVKALSSAFGSARKESKDVTKDLRKMASVLREVAKTLAAKSPGTTK